jgi:hypothetical protein
MKAVTRKQLGFFDPVTGLALLAIFGLTGTAVNSAYPVEPQQQVTCIEADNAVVQENCTAASNDLNQQEET